MNRKKEKREGNGKYEGNEMRGMNRFGESTNNEIDTNELNEIKIKRRVGNETYNARTR